MSLPLPQIFPHFVKVYYQFFFLFKILFPKLLKFFFINFFFINFFQNCQSSKHFNVLF